jgi:uncharacterized protein YlxW (UPF0749 family)
MHLDRGPGQDPRISALQQQVATLQQQVNTLKQEVDTLKQELDAQELGSSPSTKPAS